MTDEQKQKKIDHRTKVNLGFGISAGEWAFATVAGLGSALVAAATTIRNDFAETVKEWPVIKELTEKHGTALRLENQKFLDGKSGSWKDHQKGINTLKDEYAVARETILKTRYGGIISRGSKPFSWETFKGLTYGTWQRLGFAGKSTEGRILLHGTVGAAIGTAATLSFFNGVATRSQMEHLADATQLLQDLHPTSPAAPEAPAIAPTDKTTPTTQVATPVKHQKLEAANDPIMSQRA